MAHNVISLGSKLSETKLAIALYAKCYDNSFQTLWFSQVNCVARCHCIWQGGGVPLCLNLYSLDPTKLDQVADK